MKKIIELIFQPFIMIGNSQILTRITNLFNSRKWALYILTTVITLTAIFFLYVFPNL